MSARTCEAQTKIIALNRIGRSVETSPLRIVLIIYVVLESDNGALLKTCRFLWETLVRRSGYGAALTRSRMPIGIPHSRSHWWSAFGTPGNRIGSEINRWLQEMFVIKNARAFKAFITQRVVIIMNKIIISHRRHWNAVWLGSVAFVEPPCWLDWVIHLAKTVLERPSRDAPTSMLGQISRAD